MELLLSRAADNHTSADFTERGGMTTEMDFQTAINSKFFKAWGSLYFKGYTPLPYLILNATLFSNGIKVDGAGYMLIDVGPNESHAFDLTTGELQVPSGGPGAHRPPRL
jgi:hypothetical protein